MRIALINTNLIKPPIAPIALDYLAEALHAAHHEPVVLDLCFAEDYTAAITDFFSDTRFDLVGFTLRNTDDCAFTSRQSFLEGFMDIVQKAREHSEAPFIVGGMGYSIQPAYIMELCGADFGVFGEGEATLVELVDSLSSERSKKSSARLSKRLLEQGDEWSKIPGLLWRMQESVIRNRGNIRLERGTILSLPNMTRSFIDNRRYYREGGQAGIEMKRGCPKRCIYCPEPLIKGRKVRLRPPDVIVFELERLLEQGITHVHTCDSEFNIPSSHAEAVCRQIIERGLGEKLQLYAYCSPAPFTRELARLMKRAGFAGINFGVDSGDPGMLKRLDRDYTPEDIMNASNYCREEGMAVMLDLLFGSPGESEASIARTIELMKKTGASRFGVSAGVRVYSGTVLEKKLVSSGILSTRMFEDLEKTGTAGTDLSTSEQTKVFRKGEAPSDMNASPSNETDTDLPTRGLFYGNTPSDPIFFLEPEVASSIFDILSRCIAGDERFFFFDPSRPAQNYNYNANQRLVDAIQKGFRGAYWDILRRYR